MKYTKYFNVDMSTHTSFYSKGFTAITNDVLTCNRLTSSEKVVLNEIIHHYSIQQKRAVKVKKWLFENAVNVSKRSIRDILNSLVDKKFLEEFEIQGGYNGTYTFYVDGYFHLNSHVLVSEIEKEFLKKILTDSDSKYATKQKFQLVLDTVAEVRKQNLDKDFIKTLDKAFEDFRYNIDKLISDEEYKPQEIILDNNRFNNLSLEEDKFSKILNQVVREYREMLLDKIRERAK